MTEHKTIYLEPICRCWTDDADRATPWSNLNSERT